MLDASISAIQHLIAPGPLLAFLILTPIALVSGILPGGGLPVTVVIVSFAAYLDPWTAIPALIFYSAANDITQPVPSILMGIPGSRSSQATILDGYPLTQRGEAGIALGASYTAGLVGGPVGAAVLLASIPLARQLLLLFGSAEFFLLTVIGILTVAVVSSGAYIKGILTGSFAIGVAMIGTAPILGSVRATFGIEYLWEGVGLAPLAVGLFALPEAFDIVVRNTTLARTGIAAMLKDSGRDVRAGMLLAFRHWWLLIRCSLIGTFVGALPGIGGSGAHWMAYAHARQTERGARETFGTGDIRGVIAAEASNNSSDGGALMPTLFFGIPASSSGAFLLATMALSGGIAPGPGMLAENLDLTIGLVITIAAANIILVPIVLLGAPLLVRIAAVPPNILAPVIIGMVTISALLATRSIGDLVVVLVFGALGTFMKAYGWPRPPMLIAVVLAVPLERFLWISTNTYGFAMLLRPQFLGILAAVLVLALAVGGRKVRNAPPSAAVIEA